MKIIFSIFLVLFSSKQCGSNKTSSELQQKEITIIYQAVSRGFFEEIKVKNDTLTYCNDPNRVEFKTIIYDKQLWEDCIQLLSKVDIDALPKIESPTSYRNVDGAAHATLTVIQGKDKTESSTFDHGHPPPSIKALVEKLISIKKTATK